MFAVHVNGQFKGDVLKKNGRWNWERPNGGVEVYARRATMTDVREHIMRVCLPIKADRRIEAVVLSKEDVA